MEPSATHSVSSALMPDDPSFSSYLRPEPNRESEKGTADQDTEISIFDAKRYFDEGTDNQRIFQGKRVPLVKNLNNQHLSDPTTTPRFSSASSGECYGSNYRARSFHATPTASSEASWNSQTGLLSNPPGAISVSLRTPPTNHQDTKRTPASTARWLFGKKCPCSDKKSVQVKEKAFSSVQRTPIHLTTKSKKITSMNPQTPIPNSIQNHPQPTNKPERTLVTLTREWETKLTQEKSISSHRITTTETRFPANPLPLEPTGFTFPILNQTPLRNQTKPHITKSSLPSKPNHTTPPLSRRNSLEIYQPKNDPSTTTIKKPSTQRQSFTLDDNDEEDGDLASDGSSDLFEIESISTQATTITSYPMYQLSSSDNSLDEPKNKQRPSIGSRRQSLDDPTEVCYPPPALSEVSIEWSVNTIQAFDRTGREPKRCNSGGLLLSCRCEKAVNTVGPKPMLTKSHGGGVAHGDKTMRN